MPMRTNYYPSLFRNWLRLRCWFGIESNFAGPQSPNFGALGSFDYDDTWLQKLISSHKEDIYQTKNIECAQNAFSNSRSNQIFIGYPIDEQAE